MHGNRVIQKTTVPITSAGVGRRGASPGSRRRWRSGSVGVEEVGAAEVRSLPLDRRRRLAADVVDHARDAADLVDDAVGDAAEEVVRQVRSEEHTSELQSLMRISYAVFCLKKKKKEKPSQT